jgi:hypothetical protein
MGICNSLTRSPHSSTVSVPLSSNRSTNIVVGQLRIPFGRVKHRGVGVELADSRSDMTAARDR